jgi:hypothetical protein
LQLNELRLAERSPAGAAVKNDHSLAVAPVCVQVDRPAVLVGDGDAWERLTDGRSQVGEIGRW